jgi:hAT family C-terminal dimerisation region
MARNTLSVPASGYTVERVFSISERIAIWQRNRLNADTISQTMSYKYAMAKANNPLFMDDPAKDGDVEIYPVQEKEGNIPEEWVQYWWCTELDKVPVGNVSVERMFPLLSESEEEEEKEDLYG